MSISEPPTRSIHRHRLLRKVPQTLSQERRMVPRSVPDCGQEQETLPRALAYTPSRRNNYGRNIILKRWASWIGYYILMPLFNHIFRLQARANDELIGRVWPPFIIWQQLQTWYSSNERCIKLRKYSSGFSSSQIAIGPNIGNIGELLNSTGNPTFLQIIKQRLYEHWKKPGQAIRLGKGEMNYTYAL